MNEQLSHVSLSRVLCNTLCRSFGVGGKSACVLQGFGQGGVRVQSRRGNWVSPTSRASGDWLKLRSRDTVEALVGAVVGRWRPLSGSCWDSPDMRELVIAGGTAVLRPAQQAQVAALLAPPAEEHPRPTELPAGRLGPFRKERVAVTLVEPSLVVEVSAYSAFEHGRWRHLTRFVRPRPDLSAAEVAFPD